MSLSLAKELEHYGSQMTADDFNDLLVELHFAKHPSWNAEELLCHCEEASAFVRAVQQRAGKRVPDHMILRRLLNLRKNRKLERPAATGKKARKAKVRS